MRNGNFRPFTAEEDAIIKAGFDAKLTGRQISQRLTGRTRDAVLKRLLRFGLRRRFFQTGWSKPEPARLGDMKFQAAMMRARYRKGGPRIDQHNERPIVLPVPATFVPRCNWNL